MKKEVTVTGEKFIVETRGRHFVISKKNGTPDTVEALLVVQAIQDGKGNPVAQKRQGA